MSMRLQREHSLPVLAVRLVQEQAIPVARLELVDNEGGRPHVRASLSTRLSHLGCGEITREEPDLGVPPDVTAAIDAWATEHLEPAEPLWLHLVKPYGRLGAIPWERDLVPSIGRPLLRLPDVLPLPGRSTSTLSIALVATGPAAEGPPPALTIGAPVAQALVRAIGDRLMLHVFADMGVERELSQALESAGVRRYHIHVPHHHRERSLDPDSLASPWLRWIRDALEGHMLDAVHFLVHGSSLGTQGAILTPLEPSRDRAFPVSVEAFELEALLNQVGALFVGFSRLPDNWSDYGLRMLADELGSHRAGPVLLHDPEIDPDYDDLAACARFLASAGPSTPPTSPALQLYVQPRQVAGVDLGAGASGAEEGEGSEDVSVPRPTPSVQAHFELEETPTWLAAAQRYLEQQEAQLMRFEVEAQTRTPTEAEVAHYDGISAAVGKAREVIEVHARRALGRASRDEDTEPGT